MISKYPWEVNTMRQRGNVAVVGYWPDTKESRKRVIFGFRCTAVMSWAPLTFASLTFSSNWNVLEKLSLFEARPGALKMCIGLVLQWLWDLALAVVRVLIVREAVVVVSMEMVMVRVVVSFSCGEKGRREELALGQREDFCLVGVLESILELCAVQGVHCVVNSVHITVNRIK